MQFLKGKNNFYLNNDNNEIVAQIIFEESDDDITINHTLVDESMAGKGIAGKLVDRVVQQAREENKKIIPICSYAKARLEKDDKYKDVIKQK